MTREDVEKAVREELARGVTVQVAVYDEHDNELAEGVVQYSRVPVKGESIEIVRIMRHGPPYYGQVVYVAQRAQPDSLAAIVHVRVRSDGK